MFKNVGKDTMDLHDVIRCHCVDSAELKDHGIFEEEELIAISDSVFLVDFSAPDGALDSRQPQAGGTRGICQRKPIGEPSDQADRSRLFCYVCLPCRLTLCPSCDPFPDSGLLP